MHTSTTPAAGLRQAIAMFLDGTQDISWAAFKEKYLAYSRGAKAEATWRRDRSAIAALEKFFMPEQLSDISPEVLEGWKSFRRAKAIGAPTINRELKAVKALLNKGSKWGYVVRRGWHDVHGIKCARGRVLFYKPDEIARILKACQIRYPKLVRHDGGAAYSWKTIALLGARAGLRRSEIHWLTWEDVDFETNMISIVPKDGWHPKDYEQRHVPMCRILRAHLQALPRGGRFVLEPRPSLGVMTSYFRRLVKKAGLRGGIHTLRHTFASHLVQAGVPLYDVSKLLGHASIKTTEIYAHLAPAAYSAAIGKLPSVPKYRVESSSKEVRHG